MLRSKLLLLADDPIGELPLEYKHMTKNALHQGQAGAKMLLLRTKRLNGDPNNDLLLQIKDR
jgi:hypothetical protein